MSKKSRPWTRRQRLSIRRRTQVDWAQLVREAIEYYRTPQPANGWQNPEIRGEFDRVYRETAAAILEDWSGK